MLYLTILKCVCVGKDIILHKKNYIADMKSSSVTSPPLDSQVTLKRSPSSLPERLMFDLNPGAAVLNLRVSKAQVIIAASTSGAFNLNSFALQPPFQHVLSEELKLIFKGTASSFFSTDFRVRKKTAAFNSYFLDNFKEFLTFTKSSNKFGEFLKC